MDAHASAHETVRALLDDIRGELIVRNIRSVKIDEATDDIEALTKVYMDPGEPQNWDGLRLTPKENELAKLLRARMGKTVSRDAIMNALYFDDPNGGPNIKIIDVFICKLRRKLIGSGFRIETDHITGYRMAEGEAPPRACAGLKQWEPGFVLGELQFTIAALLKASLGKTVEYAELFTAGFDYRHAQSHIQHLRDKLAGRYVIEAVRGLGWRMKYSTPAPALTALNGLAA